MNGKATDKHARGRKAAMTGLDGIIDLVKKGHRFEFEGRVWKKKRLIIDDRGIQVTGGTKMSALDLEYGQIFSISYLVETMNGLETDYYARFTLNDGHTKQISLLPWRVDGGIKPKVYVRAVIDTYYAYSRAAGQARAGKVAGTAAGPGATGGPGGPVGRASAAIDKRVVANPCSKCGVANEADARFCKGCGAKMGDLPREERCPGCGKERPDKDARFCSGCGSPFEP